jgi:hypothetical protein
VPERSRSPEGPRHLAPGGQLPPWWHALDTRRLRIAVGASFLALPLLVLDNLPERTRGTAEAVETVASTTEAPATTEAPTTTTILVTTAPPTTAATTTAPPTTAPPSTAPPTTRPPATIRQAAPAPPPTTAPPTTAPAPPPPSGSIEAIIHAHFGAAGDQAVVVARCESGLNPSAIGAGRYYGLFQLGREGHAAAFTQVTGRSFDEAWSDPNANAQYAAWLYARSGWTPWGCRNEL